MVVLVVVSTATVMILNQALRIVRENTDRVQAANIARSQADAMRTLGASAIPLGLTYGGPTGTDPRFTIATTSTWVGLGQQQSSCDAATPGQAYVRVHVEVTSADLVGPQVIDTLVAPQGSATVSGTGSITVKIVDQAGAPVSDVTVRGIDSAHPNNNFTYVTGPDGCLFVPNLQPSASLAVTVSRSGYVPPTATGATQTLAISAGSVTRSTFEYAAASSIIFGSANTQFPLASTTPVTWLGNSIGSTQQRSTAGATVGSLWPSTTGFTAWAGRCTDSDPQTYSAPRPAFTFTAGQSTLATFGVQEVVIRGLLADEPVRARYAGSDASCNGLSIDLGSTNEVGILRVSMPYGTWQFLGGGETQSPPAFVPGANGLPAERVTVAFTVASLDSPSPTPSTSGSSSASPTAFVPTSPAPSPSAS